MMWSANIGYILQGTKSDWDLSSIEVGLLGSCFPLGLMIGAFLWSVIGDRYGRMYSFKNTVVVANVAAICLLFSTSYIMAGISLLILGLGMGGELCVAGTVFCEFCPPSRLYYLTLMAVFWSGGGIYAALSGLIVSLSNTSSISNWRFIVGCGCLLEIICLSLRYFMDETPAYYLNREQINRAEEILDKISMQNTNKHFYFDASLKLKASATDINANNIESPNSWKLIGKLFEGNILKTTIMLGIVWFI